MTTDILVVGSGIAGLFFALKIPEKFRVTIITKKGKEEASTNLAQGGIAAVFGKNDSFNLHIKDTLRVGDGLSDKKRVELMVKEAPRLVNELWDLGVEFTKNEKGEYDLGREAAHSRRRIVHSKDLTGEAIERALLARVRESKNIEILENRLALDIAIDKNRCAGLWALDSTDDNVEFISSKVTLLATGGVGGLYRYTTNPSVATGDGIAMAIRARLKIANMEFIQFHPTTLFVEPPSERSFLISEAVRGEGGILVTKNGKPFMERFHPSASLAPRDVVARSIARELKVTGEKCVYLNLSKISPKHIRARFPNIYQTCISYGIDVTREPIPCVPAAHYLCGGILVDENGFTGTQSLYAVGETSCTAVHGANRLASNSLLESVVFSERAASHSIANSTSERVGSMEPILGEGRMPSEKIEELIQKIKNIMWDKLGIIRKVNEMMEAKEEISSIHEEISSDYGKKLKSTERLSKLSNMIIVAKGVIDSALKRKESRGLHWVEDFPDKAPEYERDTII